ncbi:MAG: sigma-70 family RNA polymerase sigma factor [Clostridiales bacterium]|jgi:RNA polymerase sigma-70 factor (ECF subfamily)|nr:sigma-70 family RNA polymerase sigma factor [Clostridiales bacterium]
MTHSDFTAVFNQYRTMIFSIAYNYCKNASDANDITQETFLKYLQSKKVYDSEEHRKAWLIRVTINKCKSLLISPWFQRTVPLNDMLPYVDKEDSELFHAVMALSVKYRIVIHLHYYVGYSTKEIATALSLGESTVRVRLLRAREKLKATLGEDGIYYEYGEI